MINNIRIEIRKFRIKIKKVNNEMRIKIKKSRDEVQDHKESHRVGNENSYRHCQMPFPNP